MRTWERAPVAMLCGYCDHETIARGKPVLIIRLKGVTKVQIRCPRCSGPAPPDLPPLIEQAPRAPTRLTRFTAGMLPGLDFKAAAAGREPGEEG